MKGMIEAGAAGVHFEDQLSSEKSVVISAAKCSSRPHSSFASSRRPASLRMFSMSPRSSSPGPTRRAPASSPAMRIRPTSHSSWENEPPRGSSGSPAALRWRLLEPKPTHPTPTSSGARLPHRISNPPAPSLRRCTRNFPGTSRLQLLALVQLETQPRRTIPRGVSNPSGAARLHVPVRHPGRLSQPQPLHVRTVQGLPRHRDEGI